MAFKVRGTGDELADVFLEDEGDGSVTLCVEDWCVATLRADGVLELCGGLAPEFGLHPDRDWETRLRVRRRYL